MALNPTLINPEMKRIHDKKLLTSHFDREKVWPRCRRPFM